MPVFLSGSLIITGSMTTSGTITAQTLVVQTITSSVSFITGSTRFGSLLTNKHTFTGSMFLTGSAINVNNSKAIIGDDISYGAAYQTLAFGSATNGFNRISGHSSTNDGLYFMAATGRGFVFRPNGSTIGNFIIASTGRVGIGTNLSSPSALLHISGSGSDPLMQISSTVSSSIFFVSGSGNIGIGTSSPSAKLSVVGGNGEVARLESSPFDASNGNGPALTFQLAQSNGQSAQLGLIKASADTDWGGILTFNTKENNGIPNNTTTERMRITSGGNVGIGTSSPGYTAASRQVLAINGGSSAAQGSLLAFMQGGVNKGYIFSIQNDMELWSESGDVYVGNNASASVIIKTQNTERLRINGSGSVGIGTSSPASILDVNGTTKSTNYTTINNQATIPASSTATILTLSSSVVGVYIIQANFGAQGNAVYGSTLIVVANAGSFRVVTDGSGANAALTLSGANVQIANALGSALDATASAILIAN